MCTHTKLMTNILNLIRAGLGYPKRQRCATIQTMDISDLFRSDMGYPNIKNKIYLWSAYMYLV